MTAQMSPLVFVLGEMVRPEPGHRLIFAYDTWLDAVEFRGRCPTARLITTAKLLNRRMIVNADGVVTVMPGRGFSVYGVVWEVTEGDQTVLERQIGIPSPIDRFGAFARDRRERLVAVEFYASRNHRHGEAPAIEIIRLLALANQRGFPKEYQAELSLWAEGPVEFDSRPTLVP